MEFVKGLELSTERVIAIISSPEFPKDSFGERHLDNVRGEIRFEHVFFSYGRRWIKSSGLVLKDMSFVIHPGEKIGFGKLTVVLLQFRYDGICIRHSLCVIYDIYNGDDGSKHYVL